ncbi:regulatory protein, luxR family [Mycolicibacterium rutilum]|uniref:Regulatory protein, luxR family n=1 Tax=Mycolicibacterium rutilum TaxID=370526 RepID=A0A1H6IVG5_MYCRU|nr:LuxR C-terminal-related transcriptional regulator [Mycolicibacterium rutilum]SEH53421.1 regulatory protein, luxR family [Mycolicibacterium rutilum]
MTCTRDGHGFITAVCARPALSEREVEVLLNWLRTGSKASVGRALYISSSTVNTHLQRIREKYAAVGRPARSKVALAIRAIQDELLTIDDLADLPA